MVFPVKGSNTTVNSVSDTSIFNGVRLRSGLLVCLDPGQHMELRGPVHGVSHPANISVKPRDDCLPHGVSVEKSELVDTEVRLLLRNNGCRQVRLNNVLAELEVSSMDRDGGVEQSQIDALVGPSCESPMEINGIQTRCLLDSGSQVTVVSAGFYGQHLSDFPLYEIPRDLVVTGAGGQRVPYEGYVVVPVSLPRAVVGTSKVVHTMVLVGPNTVYSRQVPVIVGTNTFRLLAKHCVQEGGKHFLNSLPVRCEVAFAYRDLGAGNMEGRLGPVRLQGREIVIPPGECRKVRGMCRVAVPGTRSVVLLQEPLEGNLPEGAKVVACKVPTDRLCHVRVLVYNTSGADIVLEKKQAIADVYTISNEYDVKNVISQLKTAEARQKNVHCQVHQSQEEALQLKPVGRLPVALQFGREVPEEWKERFSQRLQRYEDVFIQHEFDIGRTDALEFNIELEPGPIIRERPRPLPPREFEEAKQHIQGLLDAEIIAPSASSFASPIVLVRKKNGGLRMCVDYRRLNSRTRQDSYAVPKIEDLFLTLSGARYFVSLDLSKAYYQVPMAKQAQEVSAFTTPFGLFRWLRMPMGLMNSAPCFQRLMEMVFRDMNLVELIVFLDDVLIHGRTLEELEERTITALEKLRSFGLKLDPQKCIFGTTKIRHLGFIISADGVRPDPEKIEALSTWPVPTTVKDIKSFLGFAGFYRRFVPGFSSMAKPLNDLTLGYIPRKTQRKSGKKATLNLSSPIGHLWEEKHQKAFEAIIQALTSEVVLGIADKEKPFILHCDASGTGLGGVLYQEQDSKLRVIAYASRGLNKTEQNYPAHKREFLALKWIMTEKFRDYLLGSKVTVVTDNNPLCYILKNAKLDATSHRWLASLSMFNFDLKYKKGCLHNDADGLSRRPQTTPEEDPEYQRILEQTAFLQEKARLFEDGVKIEQQVISAVLTAKGINMCEDPARSDGESDSQHVDPDVYPVIQQMIIDPDRIDDGVLDPPEAALHVIPQEEWRKLQMADTTLRVVINALEEDKNLEASQDLPRTPDAKVLLREQKKLEVRDGVLYRRIQEEPGQNRYQLVIPTSHRQAAMRGVHEELFHAHMDEAVRQARLRFFWPYMARDLQKKIQTCERCVRRGARVQKVPMETVTTTFPLELLCIDFLTIEWKDKKQNILVIMDHFTKFAQAIPTKDQTAKTVARVLCQEHFMVYGFPERILSDQGRDFESSLVKEVCALAGIKKCRTTPYHPSGNPVERWNRTLIGMIRSLDERQKQDWRRHLKQVVHAYNSRIHESTGFSPYHLFFGRQPRLPVDLAFGIDLGGSRGGSPRQYIKTLKDSLKAAYSKARESMEEAARQNKVRYDVAAHAAELMEGDRVLVRKVGPRIRTKVDDRWESKVYRVLSKKEGLPVYTVQVENGEGPIRTLHRNLLFPIGVLEWPVEERQEPLEQKQEKTKQRIEPVDGEDGEDEEDVLDRELEISVAIQPATDVISAEPQPGPAEREFDRGVEALEPILEDDAELTPGEGSSEDEEVYIPIQRRQAVPEPEPEGEEREIAETESSSTEEEAQPIPRRSGRIRKPVDRLSLMLQTGVVWV